MTRCADTLYVRQKTLNKSSLKQSAVDSNALLFEALLKDNFSTKTSLKLVLPYLESILTSLEKVGYLSGNALVPSKFFDWMNTSKEWQHINRIRLQKAKSPFRLEYYLLRSLLRFIENNSLSNKSKINSNTNEEALVNQILIKFENNLSEILDESSSKIMNLYFEGLTPNEVSLLTGVSLSEIQNIIFESKDSLKNNLGERMKKNVS